MIAATNDLSAPFAAAILLLGSGFNIVLNVCCAIGVSHDAANRVESGGKTTLLNRSGWSIIAFLGGLWGLALYWVIHYSILRRPSNDP